MAEKIKILYVITKSNWGGAQKYVFDLATSLSKDNFEVTVALGGNGELASKLKEAGIHTVSIPHLERDVHLVKEPLVFLSLLRIILKIKPHLLHLNSSKIGGIGTLAGRFAFVPKIIFTAHGFAFNENRSFLSKFFLKFIYWVTILLSTVTICVSEGMRQQIKFWPFIAKKITVIHNGIKPVEFLQREEARKMLPTPQEPGTFFLGTIAELHPIKGLEVAIRAITEIVANYHISYFIMGDGEDRPHLEELIKKNNAGKYIFLVGAKMDAAKYLKAFDAFLLPSYSEALALVLLESGLAGLPTIASNVGGIPEIIEDKKTGLLVEAGSGREISLALSYLIENRNERERLGKNLEEKVKNQFSFGQCLEKTLLLYKNS